MMLFNNGGREGSVRLKVRGFAKFDVHCFNGLWMGMINL